jgi:DNA repair exonuclease SbcCD ATPase subunit
MSIFNYLFDNEWSQRTDIETLKTRNKNLASRLHLRHKSQAALEARVTQLESEVGELALLSKTLMRLIVEKGTCTGQELEAMLHQVDLADGVADGRVTKIRPEATVTCPGCGRSVPAERKQCLYCGRAM